MAVKKLISADSHFVEPADLWEKRIDAKYKHLAPRVIKEGEVHRWIVGDNVNLGSVGAPSQAGRRYIDLDSLEMSASLDEVPSAAYEPDQRVAAMAEDGVEAEIAYSTIGTRIYTSEVRGELMTECFRAMNDWSGEFVTAYPDKIMASALLNMDEIGDAMSELNRCANLGFKAGVIPTYPGEDNPYNLSRFDPFWSLVHDLQIPLGMHAGSERPGPGRISIGDFAMQNQKSGDAAFRSTYHYWAMRSVADLIFSGVFEKYPHLQLAVVEHDVGWVPHFIRRMDMTYEEHRYVSEITFNNGGKPSDFINNNVFFTFMEDPIFIPFLSMIGADRVMWGSDFPHRESTWPRSRQVLNHLLAGVSQEEQEMITYGNAAKLYNIH